MQQRVLVGRLVPENPSSILANDTWDIICIEETVQNLRGAPVRLFYTNVIIGRVDNAWLEGKEIWCKCTVDSVFQCTHFSISFKLEFDGNLDFVAVHTFEVDLVQEDEALFKTCKFQDVTKRVKRILNVS